MLSCQPTNCSDSQVSKDAVSADSIATAVDTVKMVGDSISATSSSILDSLNSKDAKYNKDSTKKHEAPNHKTPDESKLDSIKAAKKKKKD